MKRFARRNWRARIETHTAVRKWRLLGDSPAVIGGRGLKHRNARRGRLPRHDSPAVIGGRGLKLRSGRCIPDSDRGFARRNWRARIETKKYLQNIIDRKRIRPP